MTPRDLWERRSRPRRPRSAPSSSGCRCANCPCRGPPDELALNPLPLKDPGGGALSLTRVSGIGAVIVGVLTTVNGSWDAIFGSNTPSWAKPAFLMAVVAAWAGVAAADILGRAYARTRTAPSIIPMPTVLHARDTRRADEDCVVAAVRGDANHP